MSEWTKEETYKEMGFQSYVESIIVNILKFYSI